MTTLFYDIKKNDTLRMTPHRINGTDFDEVLFADDTICVSTDTKAMNRLLKEIEEQGDKYGLKLNKTKCVGSKRYINTKQNIGSKRYININNFLSK